MHVFFEDDGAFKAGTVLADNDTSLQVEAISGKRLKIKAANVLLRFSGPAPSIVLADAQAIAAGVDPDFLWEVSGDAEFGFAELAMEYFGRAPVPSEAAALALRLHASPMHFYKKGKGRYKAAPVEALHAARAGVERKRLEAEEVASYAAELQAHRLPPAFREKLPMLLYKPDKLALETRALAAACEAAHTHPLALLAACGAIPSTHDYHFNRFLFDAFPRGTAFPAVDDPPAAGAHLPLAAVRAFSIDDASTTEIDDAFSVRALPSGNMEIGIHIAAPALAIARGAPLDAIARTRLSTVYMPGRKITMLPESVIQRFTLAAGTQPAALSLYVETTREGAVVRQSTRAERVPIAANLRLDAISECFAGDASPSDPEWSDELRTLWRLARTLEEARGKADITRTDYSFLIDWEAPDGHVTIAPRPRGSPLDKLVAELMIHTNSSWGKVLVDAGVRGLYRTQQTGKVRMSTKPEPHQGLGVAQYLWASSPLRRYSDLVNQRQLLTVIDGAAPAYAEGDAELFAIMADFELTYSQYAELQSQMEHYWCLRWLLQEHVADSEAGVVRDNLVRFDGIPLVVRVPDLPALTPGTRVRIGIGRIDLIAATIEARFIGAT